MTAEDFRFENGESNTKASVYMKQSMYTIQQVELLMIEFAQIHVQKALKEASKKAKRREGTIADNNLTKSILNSYPLNKII